MSPLGLLAVAFAVVTFGGGAIVYLYDVLEERLSRRPATGGGRSALRRPNVRVAPRQPGLPRGLVVTVKAGGRQGNGGEVTLRARH